MVKENLVGPGSLARSVAALVLVGTACAQHPNPSFNRMQRIDTFSALFPNWRFFAPEPAQHDYHIFYRTLSTVEESSSWWPVNVITGRKPWQIGWFPGRRQEKALFDICSELLATLDRGFEEFTRTPAYRMLREFVRKQVIAKSVDIKGFQFTLVRYTGYDESGDPEIIFVSPYTPIDRASIKVYHRKKAHRDQFQEEK